MEGKDVRIILSGPRRSGKTRLAQASSDMISDYLDYAQSRPQMHDPYYVYTNLYRLSAQHERPLSKQLRSLEVHYRTYRDTVILRELSKTLSSSPIALGSVTPEATGLELKTFAVKGLRGYNLFVFDMYGKDFEVFFRKFISENHTVLLHGDRDEIAKTLASSFYEFLESFGIGIPELKRRLQRVKRAKDLKGFFERSRKIIRGAYTKETPLSPDEVTLIVLFDALAGYHDEHVKTAILLVYGPDSMDDKAYLEELRLFRSVVINTRKALSNAPAIIGITHAKIDLMYKEFVQKNSLDPLEVSTRNSFVERYVSQKLMGPYAVKSIHASLHDEGISRIVQEKLGAFVPVSVPYNVLSAIYALFEHSIKGSSKLPRELYKKVLPYPYAHIYFAYAGGI